MTTDRYTKFILTIIAAALIALVCSDYAAPVGARAATQDVNIVEIDGQPFRPMQVSRLSPALPVATER